MRNLFEWRAETACCLWEEFLRLKMMQDAPPRIEQFHKEWEEQGFSSMRLKAVGLAELCDQVWAKFTDEEQDSWGAFDWEFVPAFVEAHFALNSRDAEALYRYLVVKHITRS